MGWVLETSLKTHTTLEQSKCERCRFVLLNDYCPHFKLPNCYSGIISIRGLCNLICGGSGS